MTVAAATAPERVTVRLPPPIRRRLVAEAAAQRRTVSQLVKLMLEDALQAQGAAGERVPSGL